MVSQWPPGPTPGCVGSDKDWLHGAKVQISHQCTATSRDRCNFRLSRGRTCDSSRKSLPEVHLSLAETRDLQTGDLRTDTQTGICRQVSADRGSADRYADRDLQTGGTADRGLQTDMQTGDLQNADRDLQTGGSADRGYADNGSADRGCADRRSADTGSAEGDMQTRDLQTRICRQWICKQRICNTGPADKRSSNTGSADTDMQTLICRRRSTDRVMQTG